MVGDAIDELAASPDQEPTPEARLRALEGDLGQRLELAEEFVLNMQSSLRSMSGALLLLDNGVAEPRVACTSGRVVGARGPGEPELFERQRSPGPQHKRRRDRQSAGRGQTDVLRNQFVRLAPCPVAVHVE
jgi:hypothetical protein